MIIEGRKKKPFSEKLVAEVTLYIAIRRDGAILARDFNGGFGGLSSRTVYRYAEDIELCGFSPRIRQEKGEYVMGRDEEGDGCLERTGAPRSCDAHILRLDRILRIFDLYADRYDEALYPEGGSYEDGLTEEPVHPDVTPTEVLETVRREQPLTLRTVQRDLAVIAAALERYREIYY